MKTDQRKLLIIWKRLVLIQSLFTLTRTVLATAALLAVSNIAVAGIISSVPNMFPSSYTAHLTADNHALVALPGVGPGGVDLYATDFYVGNFILDNFSVVGGNGIETYSATLTTRLLDNAGVFTGSYMTLSSPALFRVEFDGRTSLSQVGDFTAHLLEATFSGFTASGQSLDIFLLPGNVPSALASLASVPGGFYISPPRFSDIRVRSSIDHIIITSGLMDMGPLHVDEPGMAVLLISGLAAFGARRRFS
jgi:hypothetical protein